MSDPVHVQRLPAPRHLSRVETGAVRFGDDWPGLFIPGDDAFHLSQLVRRLADLLNAQPDAEVAFTLSQLKPFADMIEQDVIVRRAVTSAS
jgi:hypothetical protein